MLDARSHPLAAAARAWLGELQVCIRAVDYESARVLFAEDVASFGTHMAVLHGREQLQRDQWSNVWPHLRDFTFHADDLRCIGDERALTVMATWDSTVARADGSTFERPGRITCVLQQRDGRFLAVHTHFSVAPSRR